MSAYPRLFTEILFAALVVFGTLNHMSSLDFDFQARGDDPSYIEWALAEQETHPSWGPVYIQALGLFVRSEANAMDEFHQFVQVLFTLIVLAFYLALRSGAVPMSAALVFTLLLAVSGANPYRMEMARTSSALISHLAVLLILLAIALANLLRTRNPLRLWILALGLFLAAYVRPELLLASLGLAGFYLWISFRPGETPRAAQRGRAWALGAGVLTAALWAWHWGGLPIGDVGAQARETMAFGQHYALNKRHWDADPVFQEKNPWNDWEFFIQRDFGDARGSLESAASNPSAFALHVARNLVNGLQSLWRMFLDYPVPIAGSTGWRLLNLLALGALLWWLHARNGTARQTAPARPDAWFPLIALIIAFPSMLSSLLFYPRDHYVIFIGVMGLLLAAFWLFRDRRAARPGAEAPLLLGGLFIAALHIAPRGGPVPGL